MTMSKSSRWVAISNKGPAASSGCGSSRFRGNSTELSLARALAGIPIAERLCEESDDEKSTLSLVTFVGIVDRLEPSVAALVSLVSMTGLPTDEILSPGATDDDIEESRPKLGLCDAVVSAKR